mmetsp:Transcript_42798/g.46468  ORF Transcript_42798/g.46468 Transcript_42798/m.46468 type:complete len:297 (-) Transcript_42798:1064-1954(-)
MDIKLLTRKRRTYGAFLYIFYPVIVNANKHIEIKDGMNETNHKIVGIFSISIYWRDTLKNILPQWKRHITLIIVYTNPCKPMFTYKINGPKVIFQGAGDHHDHKYEHLVVSRHISELNDIAMEDSSCSGIPTDKEFCPFHISVYPSEQTEKNQRTLTPLYFSLITVIIFAITVTTFIIYDYWVGKRQYVVMKTAVTTTALVSSLFPDVVVDRIIAVEGDSISDSCPNGQLKSFFNDGKDDNIVTGVDGRNNDRKLSKPIAELFPDTTVFFGDIAGFMAWSSVREPSHVFTLLETLY